MSNLACVNRLEIFPPTTVGVNTTGEFISVPTGLGRWYVRVEVSNSSGSVTPTLFGNETKSTTNPVTIEAFSAISTNSVVRQFDDSADNDHLPRYLYIDFSSVTNSRTVSVDLYYSKVDVS